MPASVRVIDSTGACQGSADLLARNTLAAFDLWTAVLGPFTANIEIDLTLAAADQAAGAGARGGSATYVSVGAFDGRTLVAPGAAYEILTGQDPNGAAADVTITYYLGSAVIAPNPLDGSVIPLNKVDLVSVLAHEIGHALGLIGYRDPTTFALSGGFATPFDNLISIVGGAPFFMGASAMTVFGGPVPMPTNGSNLFHLGTGFVDAPLGHDLMAPTASFGTNSISMVDIAVLSDLGVPTIFADLLNGSSAADTMNAGGGADTVFGKAGNDVIDGGPGVSYLRGDDGNDSLTGGGDFDDINGNMGNDTVSTAGGDDYCVGGKDNDSLSGGAGYDLVYGNIGADTCQGDDGNDIVRGGQDNDLVLGGAGDDFVSGDKGDDTMTGDAGADIFHTFGDAGLDRVTDFSLAQGDRVQLDPGTQFTVSQAGGDTVISMTGGGQMVLVGVSLSTLTGAWIFGA